jgi:predicted Zn-ribbon and HTH transcriptional regulator
MAAEQDILKPVREVVRLHKSLPPTRCPSCGYSNGGAFSVCPTCKQLVHPAVWTKQ